MGSMLVWKIAWFSVTICCVFYVTCVPLNESMIESIVEQVKKWNYYQMVIFKNSETSLRNPGLKLVKFMEQMTTILIDIETIKYADVNEPIYSSSLRISRTSTLCIILQDEEIDDIMNFLIEASPTLTRPKCLMVTDNDTYSEESFISILLQAWSLKFLDFTIVFVNDEGLPQMLSYNPFTKSFNTDEVTNTSLLFPDKLSNMNEYPLKIPIYQLAPYNSFSLENGRITSVDGYDYPYIEIFSKKLNFSLQYFIVEEARNITALFEKLILLLENNKVNLVPKPMYLGTHYYGRNVVIGKAYRDTNYVLVVPILRMSEMSDYMRILSKLSYFPINVLVLNLVFRLLRFRLNRWIHLLQILVGSPMTKQPKIVADRIIFFTVVLLSMIFTSDVFASLTDTKVASNELSFKTYEEILSSKLKVYARMTSSQKEVSLYEKLGVQNTQNIADCIAESTRFVLFCVLVKTNYNKLLISQLSSNDVVSNPTPPTYNSDNCSSCKTHREFQIH